MSDELPVCIDRFSQGDCIMCENFRMCEAEHRKRYPQMPYVRQMPIVTENETEHLVQ